LAAFLRRIAATISLNTDKQTLLGHAMDLEREATALEAKAEKDAFLGK
jgi:hypothetical protein